MRTVLAVLALMLAACNEPPPMSNVGFTVTNVHGPGLKGGNHVTCAKANTDFNVTVTEEVIRTVKVGDLCPAGSRW
jgi:hypothetical protein